MWPRKLALSAILCILVTMNLSCQLSVLTCVWYVVLLCGVILPFELVMVVCTIHSKEVLPVYVE